MLKYSLTLIPWLVLVALFSLVPQPPRVPGVSEDLVALAGHFFVYGVLAGLIYGLHMRIWSGSGRRPLDSAFIAAGISGSIGLFFEWSQHLFTSSRTFQAEDVIANAAGAVTMSAALMFLESSGSRLRLLLPLTFAAGVVVTVIASVSYVLWDPTLPYAGDHWHAAYRVVICGETQQPYPTGPGNIHTHGRGLIHIHPQGSEDEGRNANIEAFVRSLGGNLTNTSITLPSGGTFVNGDACPDGSSGVVTASKFDLVTESKVKTTTAPADYVPRDQELVIIEFGPNPDSDMQ